LYELATGKLPLDDSMDNIVQFASHVALKQHRPQIPTECSVFWKELIENCWQQRPEDRLVFPDILKLLKRKRKENNKHNYKLKRLKMKMWLQSCMQ